jgi:hypothetical protein
MHTKHSTAQPFAGDVSNDADATPHCSNFETQVVVANAFKRPLLSVNSVSCLTPVILSFDSTNSAIFKLLATLFNSTKAFLF